MILARQRPGYFGDGLQHAAHFAENHVLFVVCENHGEPAVGRRRRVSAYEKRSHPCNGDNPENEGNQSNFVTHHSALMFAASMIGVQRAISFLTSICNAIWPRLDLSGMSLAISARRLRTFMSSSALSSASVSLSRIGFGVDLGANKAFQADDWNSGSPASRVVGTFGSAGLRSAAAIA